MTRQCPPEANDSVRSTVHRAKLAYPDCDPAVVAALKRILENQIAALEVLQALAQKPTRQQGSSQNRRAVRSTPRDPGQDTAPLNDHR